METFTNTKQTNRPVIEARQLSKTFESGDLTQTVLKGLSFTVTQGEFVALMGKSGAGKSTLLYQLSALDKPTEGTVLIDGVEVQHFSEVDLQEFRLRTLGYVFQDYALIPELRAFENVAFPLLMRGIPWNEAETLSKQALDQVGLKNKYEKLPSQLSGGEQQRVAIARAVVGKPKILFADEPTANLDTTSGRAIIGLLSDLNKAGITIVMVTHEEEYAAACKRIVVLEDGVIIDDRLLSASSVVV